MNNSVEYLKKYLPSDKLEEGIKLLKEAKADQTVLALKSFETLANVANGQATKIIVPSELQNIASLGTTLSEMFKDKK